VGEKRIVDKNCKRKKGNGKLLALVKKNESGLKLSKGVECWKTRKGDRGTGSMGWKRRGRERALGEKE